MDFQKINGWEIRPLMNVGMIFRWEAVKDGYAERFTTKTAAAAYAEKTPGKGY